MFRRVCIVIGFVCLLPFGKSSAAAVKPVVSKPIVHTLQLDTSKVELRSFNKAALRQYSLDKNFQYNERDLPELQLSWWTRFWHWFWRFIGNIFSGIAQNKGSWFVFNCLLFIIAGGFLVFIILKILGIDVIRIFRKDSRNIQIPYSESLENIHEISFDSEIESAVANRNYRFAVRLLYLRCLKQLSDAQLIHWQIEKTNTSYLNELDDTEYRQLFGLLTTQFEYIWYGDFSVDGASFQNINTLFNDLKKALA